MEEFTKTSCSDLITLWLDVMRPQTQWSVEGKPGKWNASQSYIDCIEKIESSIAEKLNVTLLETRIILNCKKTCQDAYKASLFNNKKRKSQEAEKTNKYLNKLSRGMGEINQIIFEAHHALCKLEGLHEDN